MWKMMTIEQKGPYVLMEEKDKLRKESQVQELRVKGYFVNAAGVKSTDMKKKVKRVKDLSPEKSNLKKRSQTFGAKKGKSAEPSKKRV